MLYLMSTTVIPSGASGDWTVTPLALSAAQEIVRQHEWVSAVGHESTAEIMSGLLEQPVEANRLSVAPEEGDHFLCFKLKRRPPEGAILDKATLEAIGFEWVVMTYRESGFTEPLTSYVLVP
jgi:hypothetical protein